MDFLALIVLDPRGESTCQLPGRLACRLFGLFFNVPGLDFGLDGLDRVGDLDTKGDPRLGMGDDSTPGLIRDAIVAVLGSGAGEEGKKGMLTSEWFEGIRIERSICRWKSALQKRRKGPIHLTAAMNGFGSRPR